MNPLLLIVIVLLILALVGAPNLGVFQHGMGYYPSGVLVVIAVLIVVLLVFPFR